ncbi:phosphate ABC transporter permease PstA [Desulfobacca acetoxidans]|uniref:Phosphate transport system permease protein PstA n=1 Tax=Desulfobacca acetoxidans (strain ATCC 700848 / DSM 11109 / ASRB2) TaxID=880072 RepID=F2NDV8_DESAR|nr:phosphate ABC transporter permease PstA [Desulfobacca acetoxidans]AEB10455.1 phosphate ABC transporter, inner membrane subunit PstA [Desulfobacca acetoxidans DSM 11109]
MISRPATGRRLVNLLISMIAAIAACLGIFILLWITLMLAYKGLPALNLDFFSKNPTPPMVAGGGLANAILGTLLLTFLATVMAVPIGLLAGVCLGEFGQHSKLAEVCRFASNVLTGMPSIIVGVFVYGLLVLTTGNFSGFAGAVALAIIMLPVVARTTEDMLRLVPDPLRESALAMGCPRWRVTLAIVFRAARSGIMTGVLLGVARVSGETAPLLFTALNSPYMISSLMQPTPNLTVTIFNYAMSPYEDWQRLAWGASLLITASILVLNLLARLTFGEKKR